ncbi:UNVERIFIED_CONTAM: DNA-binding transcriptional MerR regulator [Acetivibrio alkalicellulosi]
MKKENKLLTVGEMAKKMDVSIRTVQYYDQIGLLNPSDFTEGGRRLYTLKDYITLHQIISLKDLGFSLKEIKERLMKSDTVEEIDKYLNSQENLIEEEIKKLQINREIISKFRQEMKKVKTFDWEMLVEILSLLRKKDENYWIVKYFDKDVFEKLKIKIKEEKGKKYLKSMLELCDKALILKEKKVNPKGEKGLAFAKKWWGEIIDFTDGDVKMIEQMSKIANDDGINTEFMTKFKKVEDFITNSLIYMFEQEQEYVLIQEGGKKDD